MFKEKEEEPMCVWKMDPTYMYHLSEYLFWGYKENMGRSQGETINWREATKRYLQREGISSTLSKDKYHASHMIWGHLYH